MVANRVIVVKILIIVILFFLLLWLLVKNMPSDSTFIRNNVQNCEKVNLNDTLEEVLRVMGNPDQVYNYERKVNGRMMIIKNYHYSAPLTASVGVDIYFNPSNNKVIEIECKD